MEIISTQRPIVVAIAGPNGAGKSTFYEAHLKQSELPFINADVIALESNLHPYAAADEAERRRRGLIARRESFVFETVLSDPEGEKINSLCETSALGYAVVLCFVGLESSAISKERVAVRANEGGHDVPVDKLAARFPRTLANLARAVATLPHVIVFDNSDLANPYRFVAEYQNGRLIKGNENPPAWFRTLAILDQPAGEPGA